MECALRHPGSRWETVQAPRCPVKRALRLPPHPDPTAVHNARYRRRVQDLAASLPPKGAPANYDAETADESSREPVAWIERRKPNSASFSRIFPILEFAARPPTWRATGTSHIDMQIWRQRAPLVERARLTPRMKVLMGRCLQIAALRHPTYCDAMPRAANSVSSSLSAPPLTIWT